MDLYQSGVPRGAMNEDSLRTETLVSSRRSPTYLVNLSDSRAWALEDRTLLVGAAPDCSVVLRDHGVSRVHCRVEKRGEEWWVVDNRSKNGTFVNGIRVQEARLSVGDSLELGNAALSCTLSRVVDLPGGRRLRCGQLVSRDPRMHQAFRDIERLAGSDLSVMIRGESGTGKELAARALHDLGPRARGPFVPINCGGLPEPLLEAELFGHEKGAFTGAERSRAGVFEAAHGGTLFLDEIGELPLDQQAVLLRILDTGAVRRLGSVRLRHVDVRVVAATNRDLVHMVQIGSFRQDLFFRLAEASVHLPPLRSRPGDISLLVRHFLNELPRGQRIGEPPVPVLEALLTYSWPGNVRELRNVVRRASVLGWQAVAGQLGSWFAHRAAEAQGVFQVAERVDAPQEPHSEGHALERTGGQRIEALRDAERRALERALSATGGNQSQAARLLGVHRSTLRSKLKRYGML